jgi:hypothetical protein
MKTGCSAFGGKGKFGRMRISAFPIENLKE